METAIYLQAILVIMYVGVTCGLRSPMYLCKEPHGTSFLMVGGVSEGLIGGFRWSAGF